MLYWYILPKTTNRKCLDCHSLGFSGYFICYVFFISYYFLLFVTCVMVSKFLPVLKFLGYSLCNSFILLFSREFIFSCVIKLILNFVELISLCLLLFGVWVYSLMSFELFPILPCSLHVSVLVFFFGFPMFASSCWIFFMFLNFGLLLTLSAFIRELAYFLIDMIELIQLCSACLQIWSIPVIL